MIRVLIAEDERLAREELSYYLSQEADIELLPCAVNGRELLEKVAEYEPDVVFLDIKMPELEGVQAARMLSSRKQQPLIVFCTAYENYALDAFSLNAVDYLLKPTEPHRLKETLQRIRKRLQESAQGGGKEPGMSTGAAPKVTKLLLEEQNRFVVIEPESILFAVRDERVIQIHTLQETFTSKMTLQQLEEKLHAYPFFRTHRSYLVNLQYVAELVPWFNGAYNLKLKTGKPTQIPVSRSYARELLKRLEGSGY
ncbi:LytR/AlgR family response regulator transcription factor [Brevibacillus migulae]|uniref:LytR/AlgR family response regulator transcription factor n=1 Tax=Brevibacillus migulae TaxID=1644114 RepID=UPI00106EDE22|nr:LytTR family DNA-binding domain-containing protein [Brevibacillus migulae]